MCMRANLQGSSSYKLNLHGSQACCYAPCRHGEAANTFAKFAQQSLYFSCTVPVSVPGEECGVMLVLKFTASNSGLWPSLYRKPLALRERIFACETVEGLARSFMSFKKYKF